MIYNEDCLEGMKRLESGSIDLILTDLPFGMMEYEQDKRIDLKALWAEFKRLLSAGSSAVLFAAGKFEYDLVNSNFKSYRYKWIWHKNIATNFINSHNCPLNEFETILVFSDYYLGHESFAERYDLPRMRYNPQGLIECNKECYKGIKSVCQSRGRILGERKSKSGKSTVYVQKMSNYPGNILNFDAVTTTKRFHPNEKPVALLEYLIRTYTDAGQTVLDATMGSGSCGVACVNTGRNFIGFEIDKGYYQVAEGRINEARNNNRREQGG